MTGQETAINRSSFMTMNSLQKLILLSLGRAALSQSEILWEENVEDWADATFSIGIQEQIETFRSNHRQRQLTHTVPPIITPRGCDYSFDHDNDSGSFVDTIFCPNWCGDGQDFTFITTTACDGTDCVSVADCRVIGCTDSCGPGPGECACTESLTAFEQVCVDACETGPPDTPAPVVSTPPPVAPTPSPPSPVAPTLPPPPSCFSDTTELFDFVSAADTSSVSTYTLCPNTVFDIGNLSGSNIANVEDGMVPLVARTNTVYRCGTDGSSANSCTLRGGQVQALSAFSVFEEGISNCVFQGITFESANGAGASLSNIGDITFEDCIFKDHANVGPMVLTFDPNGFRDTRRLVSFENMADTAEVANVVSSAQQPARELNVEKNSSLRQSRKRKVEPALEEFETPIGETLQEVVDGFTSRHVGRQLSHTVPPFFTPRGCDYDFDHTGEFPAAGTYVDTIFCPNWCGDGQDMTFITTTECTGAGCDSTADCRVIGCTDDAGPNPGDSPCNTMLTSFEQICTDKCTGEPSPPAPTAPAPTATPPTAPPPTATPPTPPAPTATPPTAPPPTASPPTAAPPSPTASPPTATPPAPTATPPTPPAPTTPENRQVVRIQGCVFSNNEQGMPLDETSRGIITTGTGFNDIIVSLTDFVDNIYGNPDDGLGYAILAVQGSSVDISDTRFIGNDFTGLGAVVVLNGGDFASSNITGTADEDLECSFMAVSSGGGGDFSCVEFDTELQPTPPPPTATPPSSPTPPSPTMTVMPTPPGTTPAPTPAGVPKGTEEPTEGKGKGGKMGKTGKSKAKSKKSKKSKMSMYCGSSKSSKSGRCA